MKVLINKRPSDPYLLLHRLSNRTKLHLYVCLPNPEVNFLDGFRGQRRMTDARATALALALPTQSSRANNFSLGPCQSSTWKGNITQLWLFKPLKTDRKISAFGCLKVIYNVWFFKIPFRFVMLQYRKRCLLW